MNSNRQSDNATDTLAPQQAVQDYLDALLQNATTQADIETKTETETDSQIETVGKAELKAELQATVEETVETTAETTREAVPEPPPAAAEPPAAALLSKPSDDGCQAVSPADDAAYPGFEQRRQWQDGRPAWAQRQFECLLFSVAGLTLAVPLVELGGVLTLKDKLTPLVDQPEWFLGLLPSKTAGTVKVIDSARWVMPERYTAAAREGLNYVILIQDSEWGMACHEVAEAITLQPDQVRWRSDRGRRPWLAGTVIEHMCAIMDVAALVELVSADRLRIKAPQWSRPSADNS